jgi:hypothetical protein
MRRIGVVLVACGVAGCALGEDGFGTGEGALREGTPEATGVLRFLNGPAADVATLDIDAALDARAARNIVAHVRGADGALGGGDDDLLDSVAELDAISQVGPSTIDRLVAYVRSIGGVPTLDIEGVLMTEAEAASIVMFANGGTERELDVDADLDVRAARNLIAARPLADIHAVARVSYVGAAALERLRVFAPTWGAPPAAACHPGILDGMIACLEAQGADPTITMDEARAACVDAEAMGPVFDSICATTGADFCGLDFETFYTTRIPPCAERFAAEWGTACRDHAECGGGYLRCFGTPNDGSSMYGACVDSARPVEGNGDPCSATNACGPSLVCAGLTWWEEGICVRDWMSRVFTYGHPIAVPATANAVVTSRVVVRGLSSVPVDFPVTIDLTSVDPRRVRVELTDPNGDKATLWNGAVDTGTPPPRLLPRGGISGDDYVNGWWTVTITTLAAGPAATITGWELDITSRWD